MVAPFRPGGAQQFQEAREDLQSIRDNQLVQQLQEGKKIEPWQIKKFYQEEIKPAIEPVVQQLTQPSPEAVVRQRIAMGELEKAKQAITPTDIAVAGVLARPDVPEGIQEQIEISQETPKSGVAFAQVFDEDITEEDIQRKLGIRREQRGVGAEGLNQEVKEWETKWAPLITEEGFTGSEEEYQQYQQEYTNLKARADAFEKVRQESIDRPSVGESIESSFSIKEGKLDIDPSGFQEAGTTLWEGAKDFAVSKPVEETLIKRPLETALGAGAITFLGTTAIGAVAPKLATGGKVATALGKVARVGTGGYGLYLTGVPSRVVEEIPFRTKSDIGPYTAPPKYFDVPQVGFYKTGTGQQKFLGAVYGTLGATAVLGAMGKPKITYGKLRQTGPGDWYDFPRKRVPLSLRSPNYLERQVVGLLGQKKGTAATILGRTKLPGFTRAVAFPKEQVTLARTKFIKWGFAKVPIGQVTRDVGIASRAKLFAKKGFAVVSGTTKITPEKVSLKVQKAIPLKAEKFEYIARVKPVAKNIFSAKGEVLKLTKAGKPFAKGEVFKSIMIKRGEPEIDVAGKFTRFLRGKGYQAKSQLWQVETRTWPFSTRTRLSGLKDLPKVAKTTLLDPIGPSKRVPTQFIRTFDKLKKETFKPKIFEAELWKLDKKGQILIPTIKRETGALTQEILKGGGPQITLQPSTYRPTLEYEKGLTAGLTSRFFKAPQVRTDEATKWLLGTTVGADIGGVSLSALKLRQQQSLELGLAQRQVQQPAQTQLFRQAQRTTPSQATATITLPVTTTTTVTTPRPRPPRTRLAPPTGRPPFFPFPVYEGKKKKKLKKGRLLPAYLTLIRRRGKFRPLKGLAPKGVALKRGAEIVKQTLAASFKIQKTKRKLAKKDIKFTPSPKIFRKGKTEPGVFVQRGGREVAFVPGRRLASPGERREFKFWRRR